MSNQAIIQNLAERVRHSRRQAGLSRKALADRADVSERYLNHLEKGEANASIGVLTRIADALALDLAALLVGSAAEPAAKQLGPAITPPAIAPPLARLIQGMSEREQDESAVFLERFLDERRRSLRGVALLGLRGAGKTTIGQMLSSRHGLAFVSITREIERRAGMPLNDLFNLGGVESYRNLEIEVATALAARSDRIVLETAGGIVGNPEALEIILKAFKTVWLKATPEEHLSRVIAQGDMRPMGGNPRAIEQLKALLAQRQGEYGRAECVIDTSGRSAEACAAEIEAMSLAGLKPH